MIPCENKVTVLKGQYFQLNELALSLIFHKQNVLPTQDTEKSGPRQQLTAVCHKCGSWTQFWKCIF